MASITSLRCILAHLSIACCLKAFTASAFLYSVLLLQIFVRGKLLFSRGYLAATNEYRGPTDQEAVAVLCGRKGNRGSEPVRYSEMNAGVLRLIKLTFLDTRQLYTILYLLPQQCRKTRQTNYYASATSVFESQRSKSTSTIAKRRAVCKKSRLTRRSSMLHATC